ncbi:MAG: lamin tail domain-containing protein [Thermoplasmatota archaeon]
MRYTSSDPKRVRSSDSTERSSLIALRTLSVALVILMTSSGHGYEVRGTEREIENSISVQNLSPCLGPLINEVYPEPDIDVNGDGDIDTYDEFIELYNPGDAVVDLSNWTLSDNYDGFDIPGSTIGPGEHMTFWRNMTDLRLGRDDRVILMNCTGSVVDSFEWAGLSRGCGLQRTPDGSDHVRKVFTPSPDSANCGLPMIKINEIMVDPEGANAGNQWMEIINIGGREDLKGFRISNGEGVMVDFEHSVLQPGERRIVFLGEEEDGPIVPAAIQTMFSPQTSTLYTTGDALFITDLDGRTVDHVAWGSSSHVERPGWGFEEEVWKGKYWDAPNRTMSSGGEENPIIVTGRSLARYRDGEDTSSPSDWCMTPWGNGDTIGWENHIDPSVGTEIGLEDPLVEKGSSVLVPVRISNLGNMTGVLNVSVRLTGPNWTIDEKLSGEHRFSMNGTICGDVIITAPSSITIDRTNFLVIDLVWEKLHPISFSRSVGLTVPSTDVKVDSVILNFDGREGSTVPSGAELTLAGEVRGGGEIDPGSVNLSMMILVTEADEPLVLTEQVKTLADMTSRSVRSFVFYIDTLGFAGNYCIRLEADAADLIEEFDETNNDWEESITVIPAVVPEGQQCLLISEVLWNCSYDEAFVTVQNPTVDEVDISGVRISDGMLYMRFPDGRSLQPNSSVSVLWGAKARDRLENDQITLNVTGGVYRDRMLTDGPFPDPAGTGTLFLRTEFRIDIDMVVLRRDAPRSAGWKGEEVVETTWGTVLTRIRSSTGALIDTNTSLDWRVHRSTCRIHAFLPDPGINGPGEFVAVVVDADTVDVSGFHLRCSGTSAVIPNGTTISRNDVLVISRDPERYHGTYGDLPGLAFGSSVTIDGVVVEGCEVPGSRELVLPNNGGELVLMDRSNQVVDLVRWGADLAGSIGMVEKDTILGRPRAWNGSQEGWRAMGVGRDPLPPWVFHLEGPESAFIGHSPQEGLKWILESGNAFVVTPMLDRDHMARRLSDHMERGWGLELVLTHEPWTEFEGIYEKLHPSSRRAGFTRFLLDKGADIWIGDAGSNPSGTSMIICGNRILIVAGPLSVEGDKNDSLPSVCFGLEFGPDIDPGKIERIKERYRRISSTGTDGLALAQPLEPASFPKSENAAEPMKSFNVSRADTGHITGIEVSTDLTGRVLVYYTDGPIDMVDIMHMARESAGVSMIIGPGNLEVMGDEKVRTLETESSRIYSGRHLLSQREMGKNVLLRAAAFLIGCEGQGIPAEVRIGGAPSGHSMKGMYVSTGTESRISLPSAISGSASVSIGFEHLEDDPLREVFENSWTGANPFPWGLLSGQGQIDDGYSGPLITEVYYDTYLADDPDEFISITNFRDVEIDLNGYMLTDDEGLGISSDGLVVLGNVVIGSGESVFITGCTDDLVSQNGDLPNVEWTGGNPHHAFQCHGMMRLANDNDTVSLRDPTGAIVDIVTWGSARLPEYTWRHHESGSWRGPAAPDVGWGRILERKNGIDTNSRQDWLSLRPRFPGQSRFGIFEEGCVDSISVGVCPDSGSELVSKVLDGARRKILLNIYEMDSGWITSRLTGLRQRGVDVKVLLEGNPVGGVSHGQEIMLSEMATHGIEVRLMTTDTSEGVRDRYRYDHAKYMVIDDEVVLISSDNFKDTSFPPPGEKVDTGTRGWVVSMSSTDLASDVSRVFQEDWEGQDMIEWGTPSYSGRPDAGIGHGDAACERIPRAWYEPLMSMREGTGTVMVSPDHLSMENNPLLRAIRSSEMEIMVELMDIGLEFMPSNMDISDIPSSFRDDNMSFGINALNPYLKGLIEAAGRGVNVKVLLDGSDFNGDGDPDCTEKMEKLRTIIERAGCQKTFSVMVHPSPRFDMDKDIGMVHNKGMIIDERFVWISSFNWNPTSALENRELGILLESRDAALYLKEVMLNDMGSHIHSCLDTGRLWSRGTLVGERITTMEVGLDIWWKGEGDLTIELQVLDANRNSTASIESVTVASGFKGAIVLKSSDDRYNIDQYFMITVRSDDLTSAVEMFQLGMPVEVAEDADRTLFDLGWLPILIVLLAAISISLVRSLLSSREEHSEE